MHEQARRVLATQASSSRSSVVRMSLRTPASASACFTHAWSDVSVRSSSRATWDALFPPFTMRTASAFSCALNVRRARGCFIGFTDFFHRTLPRSIALSGVSVSRGEGHRAAVKSMPASNDAHVEPSMADRWRKTQHERSTPTTRRRVSAEASSLNSSRAPLTSMTYRVRGVPPAPRGTSSARALARGRGLAMRRASGASPLSKSIFHACSERPSMPYARAHSPYCALCGALHDEIYGPPQTPNCGSLNSALVLQTWLSLHVFSPTRQSW